MGRTNHGHPKVPADLSLERNLAGQGFWRIAGVDEAGRGPLAGPVAAAAVILHQDRPIAGLADSKTLRPAQREALFAEILAKAEVGVCLLPAARIDATDIRKATLAAMQGAVRGLHRPAEFALIDGRDIPPGLPCPARAVIGGDGLSASIAAASIVAKVLRDRLMMRMDAAFPGYGFARHAGYGTALHRDAIARSGPCPLHRLSFAPFRNGTP